METRNAHRQVVGFAACAGNCDPVQGGIELCKQAFSVVKNMVVQVPGMYVQKTGLCTDCIYNTRMTMPDTRYIVVAIEVGFAIDVK